MSSGEQENESDSAWEDDAAHWSDGSSEAGDVDAAGVEGDDDVTSTVTDESPDCCGKECLKKKASKYTAVRRSIGAMSRTERFTSILTSLSLSAAVGLDKTDGREQFAYFAPVIGRVCKTAYEKVYDISHRTLTLYRKRALANEIHMKQHGNLGNKFARRIDEESVVEWLQNIADEQGEVIGVRVRRTIRDADSVRLESKAEEFTFLPANYTWNFLHEEFKRFMADDAPDLRVCSLRSFVRIAHQRLPHLRIRAPRSNVCDVCCIMRAHMPREVTVEESEAFGRHVVEAKTMRAYYKEDCDSADDDHVVLTMDFAQNLTLPNVPETPSMWYFMTLMSVNVFGVFCHNTNRQYNFLYSERRAKKGSNEVISMLHRALQLVGVIADPPADTPKKVSVWADNCGGQNKNSYLLWYLRLLVDVGIVREASLNFLVKGHTKNACDRGFGIVKRHILRNEAWILADLVSLVDQSTESVEAVCLEDDDKAFYDVKPFLEERYKKLVGIQKYQLFRMPAEGRGLIECRKMPTPSNDTTDIKNPKANFAFLLSMPIASVWAQLLKPAPLPARNAEKESDFYKKIVPYVPTQYRSHPFYKKPSEETEGKAKEVKQQRARICQERIQPTTAAASSSTAAKGRKRGRGEAQGELQDEDEGKQADV